MRVPRLKADLCIYVYFCSEISRAHKPELSLFLFNSMVIFSYFTVKMARKSLSTLTDDEILQFLRHKPHFDKVTTIHICLLIDWLELRRKYAFQLIKPSSEWFRLVVQFIFVIIQCFFYIKVH